MEKRLIFANEPDALAALKGTALADVPASVEGRELIIEAETAPRYHKRPEQFVPGGEKAQFCPGCPLRGVFYVLSKLWLRVIAGAGCSVLASRPPMLALDAAFDGREVIPALCGFLAVMDKARADTVAVVDAASFENTDLAEIVRLGGVVVVTDTGGELRGGVAAANIAPERHCEAAGLGYMLCSPFEPEELERALKSALAGDSAAAIICRAPCALIAPGETVKYEIDTNRCRACGACLRLDCPHQIKPTRRPQITTPCPGCGLCERVCKCAAVRVRR